MRRAKAWIFSGCESRPAAIAPAGSNRSSRGVNEAAEAFDVEGRYRRLGEHVGRNMSERYAGLENVNCGSRPGVNQGRPPTLRMSLARAFKG